MQTNKDYFELDKVSWGFHLDKQKEIKNNILYRSNNYGYRCDDFIDQHHKKHILFSGCSMTSGNGLEEFETWPKFLYDDLNKHNELSGYFNLAISGNTVEKIINNLFKYFRLFGNPQIIFLLLPPINREQDNVKCEEIFFYNYLKLDQYCSTNNIKLITTFWESNKTKLLSKKNFFEPNFTTYPVFDHFNTIFFPNSKTWLEYAMECVKLNNQNKRVYLANDKFDGSPGHPGIFSQFASYKCFKDEYLIRIED